jgi:hypothetical protein
VAQPARIAAPLNAAVRKARFALLESFMEAPAFLSF